MYQTDPKAIVSSHASFDDHWDGSRTHKGDHADDLTSLWNDQRGAQAHVFAVMEKALGAHFRSGRGVGPMAPGGPSSLPGVAVAIQELAKADFTISPHLREGLRRLLEALNGFDEAQDLYTNLLISLENNDAT